MSRPNYHIAAAAILPRVRIYRGAEREHNQTNRFPFQLRGYVCPRFTAG